MLTRDQIEQNKQKFLELIASIQIDGADTEGLVNYLFSTDFFTAPASTIYHCNYDGGLCEHSLNVYYNLERLCQMYYPNYDKNTVLVLGLLHDISKANFYEKYTQNKKIYSEQGLKHDNGGNFDWVAIEAYKVAEPETRFLAGEHGINSALLVGRYIPLTLEESAAIINHMFINDTGGIIKDLTPIYNKYMMAPLLHCADLLSTYINERPTV